MKTIAVITVLMIFSFLNLCGQNSPSIINYQGFLTDSENNQINGTHVLCFRIYDAEQSANFIWEEQKVVDIENGYFHTQLGSVTPIEQSIFNEPDRWLGITVDVDDEMLPRIRFASVAYAMNVPDEMNDEDWLTNGDVLYTGDNSADVAIGSSNSQGYKLCVYGVSAATSHVGFSDKRYKKDITKIDDPLKIINHIDGVSYNWNTNKHPNMGFDDKRHNGVIAQELQKTIPGAVFEDSNGYLSVAYDEIIPVLIECIKAQQLEIDNLKKLID